MTSKSLPNDFDIFMCMRNYTFFTKNCLLLMCFNRFLARRLSEKYHSERMLFGNTKIRYNGFLKLAENTVYGKGPFGKDVVREYYDLVKRVSRAWRKILFPEKYHSGISTGCKNYRVVPLYTSMI